MKDLPGAAPTATEKIFLYGVRGQVGHDVHAGLVAEARTGLLRLLLLLLLLLRVEHLGLGRPLVVRLEQGGVGGLKYKLQALDIVESQFNGR